VERETRVQTPFNISNQLATIIDTAKGELVSIMQVIRKL
jgi:hypothetical protein